MRVGDDAEADPDLLLAEFRLRKFPKFARRLRRGHSRLSSSQQLEAKGLAVVGVLLVEGEGLPYFRKSVPTAKWSYILLSNVALSLLWMPSLSSFSSQLHENGGSSFYSVSVLQHCL